MRRLIVNDNPENRCFGCAPDNAAGLHLAFYETDQGVEIEYTAPPEFAGAPGILHGGIQATLLDETMCMAANAKLGGWVVTGELTIRYLRPVPLQTKILARAWITETKQRSAFIEASLELDGEELAHAKGRFFSNDGRLLAPEGSA